MNRLVAFVLLTFSTIALAQSPQIKSGSTVYIEPMDGYETYLAAAFTKKHVPLIVVADRDKADYIVHCTVNHIDMNSPGSNITVNNNLNNGDNDTPGQSIERAMQRGYAEGAAERKALGETTVGMAIADSNSSHIVFSYAAEGMGRKQLSNTAEDCAKHLKKCIENRVLS